MVSKMTQCSADIDGWGSCLPALEKLFWNPCHRQTALLNATKAVSGRMLSFCNFLLYEWCNLHNTLDDRNQSTTPKHLKINKPH